MINKTTYAFAALAFMASLSSAVGADMGRPVYKAAPVVAAPAYNWTGFYLGGHAGGGWGKNDITGVNGTAPFPSGEAVEHKTNGAVAGGQIGYNFQFNQNWVVGIEGDGSWSGLDGTTVNPSSVPAFAGIRTSTTDTEVNWIASISGRLAVLRKGRLGMGRF